MSGEPGSRCPEETDGSSAFFREAALGQHCLVLGTGRDRPRLPSQPLLWLDWHTGPGKWQECPRVPERMAGEGCFSRLPSHRGGVMPTHAVIVRWESKVTGEADLLTPSPLYLPPPSR